VVDSGGLVDRIYESAVEPELWRAILAELAVLTGSEFGCLFAIGPNGLRWIAGEPAQVLIEESLARGLENPRLVEARKHEHAGFLTDHDIFTPDQMDELPFYRDFMRPRGYGWCAGTFIELPTGETLVLNVERALGAGPITRDLVKRLDALRPHLARAASLSARLGLQRAQSLAQLFAEVGLPAAMVGPRGRLWAANDLFQQLVPEVVQDRAGRLVLTQAKSDALLAAAIEDNGEVRSIPVQARGERPPYVFHVLPVRGAAQDLLTGSGSLILVMPVVARPGPQLSILQALFDLTASEAKVARSVVEGMTVGEVAAASHLSVETVRTHLKRVLLKTGVRRQAELSALLSGIRAG